MKVTIDGLADAITDILDEYERESTADVKKVVRRVANKCKRDISAGAPTGPGGYKNSWATKQTKLTDHGIEITVYSKKPGLPHLLEHGHVMIAHGKVLGTGGARPHIGRAEQAANKKLEEDIRRELS